jgi:glucose-1-phosphate thymidylyltransferase
MKSRWGIVPAAGLGTRIQPLAFSKELLPVGIRRDGKTERPRAVCEYLVDRMLEAGVTKICFVISPAKTDIMNYFGGRIGDAAICYAIQQQPNGLCDALFTALPFIGSKDEVLVGLPDTVWFPPNGFCLLPEGRLSFLLFPVGQPELFDAVVTDRDGAVKEIQVKQLGASSNWIWGAFQLSGRELNALHKLWSERGEHDQYIGNLVNAYIDQGGTAIGVKHGTKYVDVGTLHGYHEAVRILSSEQVDCDEVAQCT